MTQLIVPARKDSVTQQSELVDRVGADFVTTRHSFSFQLQRGDSVEEILDVDDTDVVELEMEDGQRLWIRVDDLESEFGVAVNRDTATGDQTPGRIRIPLDLPVDGRSRSLGKWLIKGLKIIGIDLASGISDFVSDKVEGLLDPGPGLYQCTSSSATDLQPLTSVDRSRRVLIFLHGTASSTEGSFGDLWNAENPRILDLLSHYNDQVFAFQHRTLTESPAHNALSLLKSLLALKPSVQGDHPLRIDLVSHSRGGLIGELLCRGTRVGGTSIDDNDEQIFDNDGYQRDRETLIELGALLDKADIKIERFVRVACPARGTTLADGRLDRYLSGLVNIIEKVPGLSNPVVDGISSLLLAVVHKRTEPEELPGLEAMMPTSPTIRMLNRPDVLVEADLHVLGGDVKASGFINRLKVMLTDLFYREDHDLVVNTPSMLGGAQRVGRIRYWVDEGADVNHFRYFSNYRTASRLIAGLVRDEAGFRLLEEKPFAVTPASYMKRDNRAMPIVFVLPGIMGSHLNVGDDRVWLDLLAVARGGITRLDIKQQSPAVTAVKPLDDSYGELLSYLSDSHDVRPFAYDWRRSLPETAEELKKQVRQALRELEGTRQPIRFIAHSMGGLLVRTLFASDDGKELWKQISATPGARFVMLGTPNQGSHALASMLMGRDALLRKVALLDFRNSYADLLKTIVQFDGALQLLPHQGSLDLYQPETWQRLFDNDAPDSRGVFSSKVGGNKSAGISWSVPSPEKLKQAVKVRDLLAGSSLDVDRTIYVAGVAPATPVDITLDEHARHGRRVNVMATTEGDGSVPWSTGIPASLTPHHVYYMDALHGDMANTPEAFPALRQLLEDGSTQELSTTPIAKRGEADTRFIMPAAEPDMYPDREDLVAAAMYGSRRVKRQPARKCRVRIVHDNLARSRFPVLVGHYKGDTIISAESYLDRQLQGGLRERHRLGIYPDEPGTSTVLLNQLSQSNAKRAIHPGAIVVGLGIVGELTPGDLTATLVSGLTRYALQVRDARMQQARSGSAEFPKTAIEAPVTSLLISSSNDLVVRDCLQSILRAVSTVNQRLAGNLTTGYAPDAEPAQADANSASVRSSHDSGDDVLPPVWISQVDIMELWEDRAIQATRALDRLQRTRQFNKEFEFDRHMAVGSDGRRRAWFDDNPGWWQRLRITQQHNHSLKFETLTERARVESELLPTQRKLVERFLAQASASADPQLGRTLFELLMPNSLKQYAPDRHNLILMLDDKAAAYPWELLEDRTNSVQRPMAVESGVIRQLVTESFRSHPLRALESTALIVGDPVASPSQGDHSRSPFARLPGAEQEAREVDNRLNSAGFDTRTLIGIQAPPLEVVKALYEKPYRIVHLAAHGVHEMLIDGDGQPVSSNRTRAGDTDKFTRISGLVLGDGLYLTPQEFEQMRSVPELVFINCCHLGNQTDRRDRESIEYHRLAANISTQLIRMGVRAVVAAGWAVDDTAAKVFAQKFYDRLLDGDSFGDSVLSARRAAYELEANRGGNTWGAYQCYGDPDYTLRKASADRPRSNEQAPVSRADMIQELDTLARSVDDPGETRRQEFILKLEGLVRLIPDDWLSSGQLCSSVATAYAELREFSRAAEYYAKANESQDADASIRSLEQLVSMKAHTATAMAASDKARAFTELEEAEGMIDSLIELHQSQERYSLKGSNHKRHAAMLHDKNQQIAQLRSMADAYEKAFELGNEGNQRDTFYPLQNSLAARICLAWSTGKTTTDDRKRIKQGIETLEQMLEKSDPGTTDFFGACQPADLELLKAFANNINSKNALSILSTAEMDAVLERYRDARRLGSTERELQTITTHLQFFNSIARCQLSEKDSRALQLREALKQLSERWDRMAS